MIIIGSKKGKPKAVKDVEYALKAVDIEADVRDIQRDLADMKNIGVLESIGAGKNEQERDSVLVKLKFGWDCRLSLQEQLYFYILPL
ncbi:MAG: hypothetical protein FWH22_04720 [Fibromonadales bacterium]|nr:hypothetical protein [Fibromonadales bacterium]